MKQVVEVKRVVKANRGTVVGGRPPTALADPPPPVSSKVNNPSSFGILPPLPLLVDVISEQPLSQSSDYSPRNTSGVLGTIYAV